MPKVATAAEIQLIDELLSGQLDIMRFEAGVRTRILAILQELQRESINALGQSDLPAFSKQRTQALLSQINAIISKYYELIASESAVALGAVANASAANAGAAMNTAFSIQLAVGLPTQTFLERLIGNTLIKGAPSAGWWERQRGDTAFRFANAVRQGKAAGETGEQISRRISGSTRLGIPGVMDIARSNARSLVHTSIQAVANEARLESFRKNSDVIGNIVWLATLDGSTCPEICGPRDLKPYTLEDDPPKPIGHAMDWNGGPGAIHWGCRCIVTAGTKTFSQLGVDLPEPRIGTRASQFGPVPADTTFEEFLNRRGVAFQEEVLGKGRTELWREKKLTLQQLLDLSGNPLSMSQLKAKYG